jgi:hypothetical protein
MEETVYTIRYYDKIRKKSTKTNWKMTEAEAAKLYADTTWEIIPATKDTRKTVDPLSTSMAHLQGPGSKG